MLTTTISPEKIVFDDSTEQVEVTITTNGNSIVIGSKNPVTLTGKLLVKKKDLIEENIRIITSDGDQFNIGSDCKLLPVSLKATPLKKFTFTVDQPSITTKLGELVTIAITCAEEDVTFEVKQDKFGYFIIEHTDKTIKVKSIMLGFNTLSIVGRKSGYEDYGLSIPVTIEANEVEDDNLIYPDSSDSLKPKDRKARSGIETVIASQPQALAQELKEETVSLEEKEQVTEEQDDEVKSKGRKSVKAKDKEV